LNQLVVICVGRLGYLCILWLLFEFCLLTPVKWLAGEICRQNDLSIDLCVTCKTRCTVCFPWQRQYRSN